MPREHGFWTMLAAVVIAAMARSKPSVAMFVVAALVVIAAVVLGGVSRRAIRRHEGLQLASSAVLGFAGVPIEFVGEVDRVSIALTSLGWVVVFVSSALCVRASFARASRARRSRARALELGSVLIPFVAAGVFALTGHVAPAVAALVAGVGCSVLGLTKPGVKQMKAVGLSLAGVAALAAVAISLL